MGFVHCGVHTAMNEVSRRDFHVLITV